MNAKNKELMKNGPYPCIRTIYTEYGPMKEKIFLRLPVRYVVKRILWEYKNCQESLAVVKKRRQYCPESYLPDDEPLEALEEAKIRILDLVDGMNDTKQQLVILGRYIDGSSWEDIAASLHISVNTAKVIHGHALLAIDRLVLDELYYDPNTYEDLLGDGFCWREGQDTLSS